MNLSEAFSHGYAGGYATVGGTRDTHSPRSPSLCERSHRIRSRGAEGYAGSSGLPFIAQMVPGIVIDTPLNDLDLRDSSLS